jgi:hypothetical protein
MTMTRPLSRPGSHARTFVTRFVGLVESRGVATVAVSNSTRRHPPQSALKRESCAWIQRRAAPMPRVDEIVSEYELRVPNETSAES